MAKKNSNKAIFVAAVLPAALVVFIIFFLVMPKVKEGRQNSQATGGPSAPAAETVSDFDSCVAAGYPVMESYPRQCAVPDGQTFTETVDADNSGALVGGDRDEHGCIGSAGYVWCAPKEKCLRIWEEACYGSVAEEIQYRLADKHGRPADEVHVTIRQQEGEYVSGSVSFGEGGPGEGGVFLARKAGNIWELAYDGNGYVDCETMRSDYGFPDSILRPNFCD